MKRRHVCDNYAWSIFCGKNERFFVPNGRVNKIASGGKGAQNRSMKTRCRLPRLYAVLCAGVTISCALCSSAVAGQEDREVVNQPRYRMVEKPKETIYYVKSSASAIPQPINRLGGIPTTTVPMLVMGDPRISNR